MRKMILFCILLFSLLFAGCGNESGISGPAKNNSDTLPGQAPVSVVKTILFFGNSLTAGYQLDPAQAFPALIQQKIDSVGVSYKVINGGVSGETSAGGNQRIDFVLKQQQVDVFVLELGANDGLRGIPLAETKKNLQSIIDKVKVRFPSVKLVLAGMQMPPNMGEAYTKEFRELYPELAKKNNMTLIPFLLEGVADVPALNLEDGNHPTPEGHKVVAETVWKYLRTVL